MAILSNCTLGHGAHVLDVKGLSFFVTPSPNVYFGAIYSSTCSIHMLME
jgi:hypothetical protein